MHRRADHTPANHLRRRVARRVFPAIVGSSNHRSMEALGRPSHLVHRITASLGPQVGQGAPALAVAPTLAADLASAGVPVLASQASSARTILVTLVTTVAGPQARDLAPRAKPAEQHTTAINSTEANLPFER